MKNISLRRVIAAIPAVVLVVAAAGLTAASLRNELEAPPTAPRANAAVAPDGLTHVTIARDWQETAVSGTKRSR